MECIPGEANPAGRDFLFAFLQQHSLLRGTRAFKQTLKAQELPYLEVVNHRDVPGLLLAFGVVDNGVPLGPRNAAG